MIKIRCAELVKLVPITLAAGALSMLSSGCVTTDGMLSELGSTLMPQPTLHLAPNFDPQAVATPVIAVVARDSSGQLRRGDKGSLETLENIFRSELLNKGYRISGRRSSQVSDNEGFNFSDAEVGTIGRRFQAELVLVLSIVEISVSTERKSSSGTSVNIITGEKRPTRSSWTEHTTTTSITLDLSTLDGEVLVTGSFRRSASGRDAQVPVSRAVAATARRLAAVFPAAR